MYHKEYSEVYAVPYKDYSDGYRYIELLSGLSLYDEVTALDITYGASNPISAVGSISITTMNYFISKCAYTGTPYIIDNLYLLPLTDDVHTRPCSVILPIEMYTKICIRIISTKDGLTPSIMNNVTYHKSLPSKALPLKNYI